MNLKSSKNAFTLVELLVVITVISILAGLLLPALKRAHHASKAINCMNNQKQIGLSLSSYADDSEGWIPYMVYKWQTSPTGRWDYFTTKKKIGFFLS